MSYKLTGKEWERCIVNSVCRVVTGKEARLTQNTTTNGLVSRDAGIHIFDRARHLYIVYIRQFHPAGSDCNKKR